MEFIFLSIHYFGFGEFSCTIWISERCECFTITKLKIL